MKKEGWVFIFILGMVLFNWPFISIFRENFTIYPFIVWLCLIVVIFITTLLPETRNRGD